MDVLDHVSLQEDFFSRKQQEGETLQEFSHALMSLIEKVVKKAPNGLPNKDVLLRDQFVEHVSDCTLRRELKQFVRSHPTTTLIDVRSEAIRWEQEGMPGGGRGRSHSVPSVFGFQHTVQGVNPSHSRVGNPSGSSELGELKEILKTQQEQLNQLTRSLAAITHAPRPQYDKKNLICRRCQRPGHFARECNGAHVAAPSKLATTAVQSSSRDERCPPNQGNFHPLNC